MATMSNESVHSNESNSKRKVKNKAPKRLHRKNKPNDKKSEANVNNIIPTTDETTMTKDSAIQESAPFTLQMSPSKSDNNSVVVPMDEHSIDYWKLCAKKAIDILEKQASSRRQFLIERHQERIDSVQYLLSVREHINKLNEENHSMSQLVNSLRGELSKKDEMLKSLQEKFHDRDDLIRNNDHLRLQLQIVEQKLHRVTVEYNKRMEENRHNRDEYEEQVQSLMDEIERIKRDLVLEEYRKQEAERKVRYYEDKIKIEQNLNKKTQQDLVQLKQELKSMHMRYDALQIEMLAMHKANHSDLSLIPTKDTEEAEWSSTRTIDLDTDENLQTKRSKRKTRDRTQSSTSTTSSISDKRSKTVTKSSNNKENEINNPSLIFKRKSLNSKNTSKNHLPMVTLTQPSPSNEQVFFEKDLSQLLIPTSDSSTSESNTSTIKDFHDTSCESQPIKPKSKKQSRYPCRRAQRPVRQIDTSNKVNQ